eukprot:12657275-Alexandrium_andersonii.AAC.1
MHGERFELAAEGLFSNGPQMMESTDPCLVASLLTNHTMHHLTMLRTMHLESSGPSSWSRRFPKSGGFRRLLNTETWDMVSMLLSKLATPSTEASKSPPEDTLAVVP